MILVRNYDDFCYPHSLYTVINDPIFTNIFRLDFLFSYPFAEV